MIISEQSPFGEMLLGILEKEAKLAGGRARDVAVGRLQLCTTACKRCNSDAKKGRLFCGSCRRPFLTPDQIALATATRALEKKKAKIQTPS